MKISFAEQIPAGTEDIIHAIGHNSYPLNNTKDLDPLLELIGNARYVLLGEASHGTHEYYTWRSLITQRLIIEKQFLFIAVEGDWPDCYRLNRYIKGYPGSGKSAEEVLHAFNRWPTWMWANWEIVALTEWLKNHNKKIPTEKRTGFYGLDVYSLWESMESICNYLEKTDPDALKTAKRAISCFEPYSGDEGESYGRATYMVPECCENEVVDLLKEIRKKIQHYNTDHEMVFSTEQNALVAVHAEHYYRAMVRGGPASWNIRDKHMVETLNRLMKFHGPEAKTIVWEHNTHIGDARATDMANEGMVNVGQLVSQEHGSQGVVKVGFGSNSGTVIAGRNWGDVMRKMKVPPGRKGSWESILHQAGTEDKLLIMDKLRNNPLFNQPIGHRAIGVVYNPEHEQFGNYVPSMMTHRYDAFIYLDKSIALHPLHIEPDGHQVPETYPWGV